MDVAILGTGAMGRRFARACLFGGEPSGHIDESTVGTKPSGSTDESTEQDPEATAPADNGAVDPIEQLPAITLYGSDATAVMDAVDALEDELHDHADSVSADHLERVDGTTDLETAVGDAAVVIETRADDIETVRHRLAGVEERLDDEAILAIHVDVAEATAAAAALERPERAVGLSMVAPGERSDDRSGLVDGGVIEVVRADQTDDATVTAVGDRLKRLGWTLVVVNDAPARIADRLQLALEVEAMRAVETDVAAPAAIDAVVEEGFGHAEGPLSSADRAGLDTRLAELQALGEELGPRFEPPTVLRNKVEAGQLGVKTGTGFREWDDDQPVDGDDTDGT